MSFFKLNFQFQTIPVPLPKDWQRHITPRELKKAGFKETQQNKPDCRTFTKSFDGLITLTYHLGKPTSYIWELEYESFRKMVRELRELRDFVEKKKNEAYIYFRSRKAARKQDFDPGEMDPIAARDDFRVYLKTLYEFQQEIKEAREGFRQRYKNFIKFQMADFKVKTPIYRQRIFILDACRTLRDVNLYCDFIRLVHEVFIGLKRHLPPEKMISADAVKTGISAYHVTLRLVMGIRKLYTAGRSTKDISRTLEIDNQWIEKFTEDSGGVKRGWKYRASDLALEDGARCTGTTVLHFKNLLKEERAFSNQIKTAVDAAPFHSLVSGGIKLDHSQISSLKREIIPDGDWKDLIGWGVAHFGIPNPDELPS